MILVHWSLYDCCSTDETKHLDHAGLHLDRKLLDLVSKCPWTDCGLAKKVHLWAVNIRQEAISLRHKCSCARCSQHRRGSSRNLRFVWQQLILQLRYFQAGHCLTSWIWNSWSQVAALYILVADVRRSFHSRWLPHPEQYMKVMILKCTLAASQLHPVHR